MVGLLLVTHGDLAKALVSSAALIMGDAPLIESYGLYHGENVDDLENNIKQAVIRLNKESNGDGVLILTDLFGGSPANETAKGLYELGDKVKAECVTGVNLPMLLEVATSKHFLSLEELKQKCLEVGPQSVISLKDRLKI